jgi:tetratricopeptide (TPR) repeat protein
MVGDKKELEWILPRSRMALCERQCESKESSVSGQKGRKSNSPVLEIRLLGRFEILRDGEPIAEGAWGRRKTKTLLKVLLTDPGRVFTQDQLIDALFGGENVDKATENLYGRVSQLRRALEPDLKRGVDSTFIIREGQGYSFDTNDHSIIDIAEFGRDLHQSLLLEEAGEWLQAVEAFETALQHYRGDLLPEDRYEDWAEVRRGKLRSQYLEALERLSSCYVEIGRLRQAISCCHKILAEEPYRESVIRRLMTYEHSSGHRARALRTYEEGEKALRDHLDIEPEAATRALYESLRQTSEEDTVLDSRRLAVVPFVNVGSDPANDFLADGMTEALIYTLSQVAGLEIIAQTTVLKYKNGRKSAAEIGQELRVGSLLEGSVQRVDTTARVLVQLINSGTEAHLWARQYDLDLNDILGLQEDVARQVAEALQVQLLDKEDAALSRSETIDRNAHTAYLKGRLFLAKRKPEASKLAIKHFELALSIQPEYPLALTGLADAYGMMVGIIPAKEGYEKALAYANQALDLDPNCAEAHAALGHIIQWYQGDFREAEKAFVRAIELNPNCSQALSRYALLLSAGERFKEACQWSEQALALDPLSANLIVCYAVSLDSSGRLVEALDQYQKAMEINPMNTNAWWGYWYCLAAGWDWDRAEAFTRRIFEEHPENLRACFQLATCVMCRGKLEEGLDLIHGMLDRTPDPKNAYVMQGAGHIHYFARKYDEAIEYYNHALEIIPMTSMCHNMIAKCYIMQERYQEALEELDAAYQVFQGEDRYWHRHTRLDRGVTYARMGDTAKAEEELKAAIQDAGRLNGRIAVAGILHALGRIDEAYDWYDEAASAREPHMAAALKNPAMEKHLTHPRYQAILRRIGLPVSLTD